jgi:polyisoprenoid-binding protein YceI
MRLFLSLSALFISTSVPASGSSYQADLKSTEIQWIGKKVFVKSEHNGTISLKSGSFEIADGKITKGDFVIDMKAISVVDIKDPTDNAKLKGHLESPDFFAVTEFPEARFVITGSKPITSGGTHEITGDLTIKGKTEKIQFPATVKAEGGKTTMIAKIPVDRTKFHVKFGSPKFFENLVGDRIISDTFDISLRLVASESKTSTKKTK